MRRITTGGGLSTTDSGIWTMNASGNTWNPTTIGGSTLRMGVANVLPTGVPLAVQSAGTLDLAGFNQQADSLSERGGTTNGHIGSSSVTSDSVLTITGIGVSSYSGFIVDSLSGGTAHVGLNLTGTGGSMILGNANSYSGPTVIIGGALQLNGIGSIGNSTNINITAGGSLNASTRSDGTFTLNAPQTLQGDGAITIQWEFYPTGTVQLKLHKAGAVLTSDSS